MLFRSQCAMEALLDVVFKALSVQMPALELYPMIPATMNSAGIASSVACSAQHAVRKFSVIAPSPAAIADVLEPPAAAAHRIAGTLCPLPPTSTTSPSSPPRACHVCAFRQVGRRPRACGRHGHWCVCSPHCITSEANLACGAFTIYSSGILDPNRSCSPFPVLARAPYLTSCRSP